MTSNFSDIESLADEIEAIAPDSRLLRPVVSLGSGFRSTVLQDAGGTVYLLGRTASVAKGYRYEVALLPTIREYLPCAVPDPHVVSGPTEGFPGGILAYPGLGGCPMRWSDAGAGADGREQLAGDLGRFLAALHRVPQKALAGLEKRPSLTSRPELEAMRLETSGTLADHLEPGEMTRLDDWWDQLIASSVMQDFSAVLTHHDFWYENLLVGGEPPRLSGVLDWEHVRLSDPVVDLVPLTYLDVGFAEEVMTAYKNHGGTVDDSFRVRFANHRVLREFGGIRYSIRHNDRVELVASIDKLRQTRVTDARR